MAGTYFKYAERNVDTQINWAEVGQNVVDMLREEERLREEKKAALDESSRQFGEVLANGPTGEFKSANEWILGYASDASQARLMQDRLLKNGLLKVKDYTIMRQNLNDGTNQMFQFGKEVQTYYEDIMKRTKGNENQDVEAWFAQQVQGLSNFKNTKAYINPTNFTVSIAAMREETIDGKKVMVMETDPDKHLTVNQLRNRINSRFDRYKYVDAINAQVDALGEFQTASVARVKGLYKVASVTEMLDPMKRESFSKEDQKIVNDYFEWEDNMIKAELANPLHQSSLLTNAIDKVPGTNDYYEPTTNEDLAKTNTKYVLFKDDGTGNFMPVFTEEQTKVATEFLRAQTRNALDRKTNIQTSAEPQAPQPMQWQYEAGREGKREVNVANMIGTLYYGNANEIDAALEYFRDSVPNAKEVVRTDNGVRVLFNDGTSRDVSFRNNDGSVKSLDMFIKGAGPLLAGQVDINTALQRGGFRRGAQLSTIGSERKREVTGVTTTQGQTVQVQANNYLAKSITPDMIGQSEEDAVPIIGRIVERLGFTAVQTGFGTNKVEIKAPDGKTKIFPLNVTDKQQQKEVVKNILAWMQGKYDEEKLKNAAKSGTFQIFELD